MKIYSQLAKFQQEVGTITKDSKGHNYKYASLDHIIEIITPFLKSNGLGFLHKFDGADIICLLFNTEGEAIDSRFTMPQEEMRGMNMNQSMGASITYARRYTLTAILGLATDEDTDGVVSRPQNNKVAPQGQNIPKKEVKKDELVVESEAFKKLVDIAPKYTVDQLLEMAKKKYEVSSATEQVIRGLYIDDLEEIIFEDDRGDMTYGIETAAINQPE
jgi:hypothetical protein